VPPLRRALFPRQAATDIDMHETPRPVAPLPFADADGRPMTLADFHGRVVLLNIWATWCTPCRDEMPTLDRLQGLLGGPDFEVFALSIDDAGLPVVLPFFKSTGIRNLRPYLDSAGVAMSTLVVTGVPLTLLINRDGNEIGRKLGPAAWDDPALVALIRNQLVAPVGATKGGDLTVSDLIVSAAWARPSVPGQDIAAVYLTIKSAEGATLIGVRSGAAGVVQIHDMTMDGNVMRMRELDRLPLPAGQAVRLQPGGAHLMMLGLKEALKPGDRVRLSLSLLDRSGAKSVASVDVPVRAAPPIGT
jgi:copper(I)-binding protein